MAGLSPQQAKDLGLEDDEPQPVADPASLGLEDAPARSTPQPKLYQDSEINPINAFGTGGVQGLTFDHADEVEGALGGDITKSRQVDAALREKYPWIYGASHLVGDFVGGGKLLKAAGWAKKAAGLKNTTSFLGRMLGAAGTGATMGALSGSGQSTAEFGSDQYQSDVAEGGKTGAALASAAQLGIGEPLRAAGKFISGRAAGLDSELRRRAEELIETARGKLGKQAQEAAGGGENIELARLFAKNRPGMAQAAEGVADTVPARRPVPAVAEAAGAGRFKPGPGDDLYHVEGMAADQAMAFLQKYQGASPDQARRIVEQGVAMGVLKSPAAAPTVAGRARPNLQVVPPEGLPPTVPGRPAPPMSPGSQVADRLGADRMAELERGRLGNAYRKIQDAAENPVRVPSPAQAMAQAQGGMQADAVNQAKHGVGKMIGGAVGGVVGNALGGPLGAAMMGGGVGYGFRQLAGAAFKSPLVMGRLRRLPRYGNIISKAAARGTAALETTLLALSQKDPEVAAQMEGILQEVSEASQPPAAPPAPMPAPESEEPSEEE